MDHVQGYSSYVLQWCILCRQHKKDLDHMLRDCQFAQYLWSGRDHSVFVELKIEMVDL